MSFGAYQAYECCYNVHFITKNYLSIKNLLVINTFLINSTKIKRQVLKYVKFYLADNQLCKRRAMILLINSFGIPERFIIFSDYKIIN